MELDLSWGVQNQEHGTSFTSWKWKGRGKCERSDVRLEEIRLWEYYCLT